MKRSLLVALCAFTPACLTEVAGPAGEPGTPGEMGEQGPPGNSLVWKDANGEVVPDAFVEYRDGKYVLVKRDAAGVFWTHSPLTGVPSYIDISTSSTSFYLTNNCSGGPVKTVDIAPVTAFKLDGRVVALPRDIDVVATAGSAYYSGACHGGAYEGAWIESETLEDLPTLTAPVLAGMPYYVDRI